MRIVPGTLQHRLLLAALGVCLLTAPAPGDDRADDRPPADDRADHRATDAKTHAVFQARVHRLIKQLADENFATREAAQRALIAEGERLVPLIDALPPSDDAEVAHRLKRIRYHLVGYRDDIDRLLRAMEPVEHTGRPLPAPLRDHIERRPQGAVDHLLAIVQQHDHELHDRATNAFVQTWPSHSPEQIERYIRANLRLHARIRPAYPQGVDAVIRTQYAFAPDGVGWPNGNDRKGDLKTRTTHFLDGEPQGQPFDYAGAAAATVGWIRTGALAKGRHEISFTTELTVTHRGKRIAIRLKSKPFAFEIIAADAPDHLAAPNDPAVAEQVRAALVIKDDRADDKPQQGFGPAPPRAQPTPWTPQVTWGTDDQREGGLYVPTVRLTSPLPVDLCYDVTLLDLTTGKRHACDPLVILKGETRGYRPCPYQNLQRFIAGRNGFIEIKLLLTPSRAAALSDPDVRQYFQESIKSDTLRARIWSTVELRALDRKGADFP